MYDWSRLLVAMIFPITEIFDGAQKKRRAVPKHADACVTVGAQQPSNGAASMIVINDKFVRTVATDGAAAILAFHHCFVLFFGETIRVANMLLCLSTLHLPTSFQPLSIALAGCSLTRLKIRIGRSSFGKVFSLPFSSFFRKCHRFPKSYELLDSSIDLQKVNRV
ncbi:hypothetical protein CQ12_38365 [Bradyrhizobium jicamae]|uniref:Uncharacterized protein n=1 Tax=Bradyrhizobium jicamae TaxID=280332 RepID=A0A0R3KQ05_9BRAD|nr:hypothetical protein CQ12_38365 [Bradyrhizobium jicamae]